MFYIKSSRGFFYRERELKKEKLTRLQMSCKFMQISRSLGNPGKKTQCVHIERNNNAKPCTKPAVLTSTSLQHMLSKGLMSSEQTTQTNNCGVHCMYPAFFPLFLFYTRDTPCGGIFSVFKTDNWVSGTSNAVVGQWNGQCQGTGKSQSCVWRYWECGGFSRSTQALYWPPQKEEDCDDLESHMVESSFICETLIVNTQKKSV